MMTGSFIHKLFIIYYFYVHLFPLKKKKSLSFSSVSFVHYFPISTLFAIGMS